MASKNSDQAATNGESASSRGKPCSRCQTTEAQTYLLRKDLFCATCLQAWIQTRLAKRITEGLRTSGGGWNDVCRLLLPLSSGISSLALLHLLNLHAAARVERSGRCGYEVCVVWIDEQSITGEGFENHSWSKIQERYPRWAVNCIPIHEVLSPYGPLSGPERKNLFSVLPLPSNYQDVSSQTLLSNLLTSLPEPSSRIDLLTSLRTRLLTSLARQENCSIILWADTTTRLAEKTLASTAKGRGFSLPWQVSDGTTPFEGISYLYPLQDLHRREIELWARVASNPSLNDLINTEPKNTKAKATNTSTKSQTIDDLMRFYFEGVEEQYPSLVANVVRTAGKLQAPAGDDVGMVDCGICGLRFRHGAGDLQAWEGNQREDGPLGDGGLEDQHQEIMADGIGNKDVCYACARTIEKAKVVDAPS